MTDALVHGGDIRVPLGVPHTPAPSDVVPALEFVTTGRPVGFVGRGTLHGLRFEASDVDFAWGDSALTTGRAIDLLMVACGRSALLPATTGPGATRLAARSGRA